MKTLCLGGSFNPIHNGHLICARAVAEAADFERVLLVPSARPPHKPGSIDLADPAHRLKMCELALDSPGRQTGIQFEISDIELQRSGPSYTIDTVREFKKNGWSQVHWLIGADMLNYLPKWHEAAALLRETEFVIMARPDVPIDWNSLPVEFSKLKNKVIRAPLIEISSSQIRSRIGAGLSIEYLTPRGVAEYIGEHGLYRDQPLGSDSTR